MGLENISTVTKHADKNRTWDFTQRKSAVSDSEAQHSTGGTRVKNTFLTGWGGGSNPQTLYHSAAPSFTQLRVETI